MIRRTLELLSRGVVLRRRLPAEFGGLALLVSPDASLKFWKRDLRRTDPLLLDAVRTLVRPGDVVWDIGANIGLFSFAAAGLAGASGKVLAVEPDPWLAQLLLKSSRLKENAKHAVEVLPAALGGHVGIAELNIAKRGRATNFLSGFEPSTQTGGVRDTMSVVCVTLDWLLEFRPAPTVLKIDVEGAEVSVLRGASRLLNGVKPRIMCEVSERNRAQASEIFRSTGYAMYDASVPLRKSAQLAQCAWNTIALPAGADIREMGHP